MDDVFRRRRLPHWDVDGASYFVTFCLAGSIPASVLRELNRYREWLDDQPRPPEMNDATWKGHKYKRVFVRLEECLDHWPAVVHLQRPDLATVVCDSLRYFAGQRYHLHAYVVMPSHVHWLFRPLDSWSQQLRARRIKQTPREHVMCSIKTYTARRCNQLLGRRGRFWQDESYDHWIDDDASMARVVNYIEQNPVRAGLVERPEDWPFSSASDRMSEP